LQISHRTRDVNAPLNASRIAARIAVHSAFYVDHTTVAVNVGADIRNENNRDVIGSWFEI